MTTTKTLRSVFSWRTSHFLDHLWYPHLLFFYLPKPYPVSNTSTLPLGTLVTRVQPYCFETFHALFLIAWLTDGDSLMCCIVTHSPDGLTEWNWNSKLRLMHWLYNSNQKYCKTDSTEKDKLSWNLESLCLHKYNGDKFVRVQCRQIAKMFSTFSLWGSLFLMPFLNRRTNFIINQNHMWWHSIYQLFWHWLLI